jgi:hypothetical protein
MQIILFLAIFGLVFTYGLDALVNQGQPKFVKWLWAKYVKWGKSLASLVWRQIPRFLRWAWAKNPKAVIVCSVVLGVLLLGRLLQ